MTAYEIVLLLVVALLGIALVVVGVVDVTRRPIAAWWKKKKEKKPDRKPGLAAIVVGAGFLTVASLLLFRHFPDRAGDAVTAIGTVSGDVITAMIAAITLYAVTLLKSSVKAQETAVLEQTKQLKITAIQNVNSEMLKLDRWLADHPDYLKALESRKDEHPKHGAAVAEVYADFIAQVVDHKGYLPPGHFDPWENYFREIIRTWPQLEKFMDDHSDWYGSAMTTLFPGRKAAG